MDNHKSERTGGEAMVRFVMYADKEEDVNEYVSLLREAVRERGEWPLIHTYIGENELLPFLHFVRRNPCLIMMVVTYGQQGRKKAMQIRENNWEARMLWFSEPENEAYSDSMKLTCFGHLPVGKKGIGEALDACEL
ncbi:MAG: hypothetical protein LUH00_11215 [Lachnospiraceae bacterium]|nr:hypothetical protein [Lachnospiraceae bacterium]